MEAAICCRRERPVERSQKVHGEAKAGGDPADMDVGSRPLTMDGNCRVGHRRPEQTVELYERNSELRPQQSLHHFHRTSAAGSANMEVSLSRGANREPELSCKTCLKRTLKRAPTFATPNSNIFSYYSSGSGCWIISFTLRSNL